jgi:L,D-peptidoglycan transpeptidase YkuD (ErfK/YbiS/YcfS/YnhG family)
MHTFPIHLRLILVSITSLLLQFKSHAHLPADSQQVVIGIAPDMNSSHVTLSIHEKSTAGWKPVGAAWTGRLGRNGLAWGIGLHPANIIGLRKMEGDGRSPAGIYRIGSKAGFVFGYSPTIKKLPSLPYKKITTRDLWVEDPKSPNYNQHILLTHEPLSAWEKEAQMRQNDHAHSLKLFIAHNEATPKKPALANAGSSIFFHIWRANGAKPTAGCTTMHEVQLKELISKIDPNKNPVYILLSSADYKKYRANWKLP